MFNLLIDELPRSVIVDNAEYPINWDAKTMMRISILIENNIALFENKETYAELAFQQLRLFYPTIPPNFNEAMLQLIEFYAHSQTNYDKLERSRGNNNEKQSYSFQYDSHLIYSAFLQQYPTKQIDKLHWFEFKAMLENLTEDCLFVKVTQWRSMKINKDMSKAEKQFYRKMKRLYALPDNRAPEQKEKDFAGALFYL